MVPVSVQSRRVSGAEESGVLGRGRQWRRALSGSARKRTSDGRRRRAGSAFVAVALIASSVALAEGGVGAQESDDSQSPESPPAGVRAEPPKTASGGWWDGTGGLAAAPPVVEEGRCDSYGGSLGLFRGGPLAKVCPSGAAATDPGGGPLSGSPRGVGWFEGFDADGLDVDGLYPDGPDGDGSPANRPDPDGSVLAGPYAGVELFGAPGITPATYRALGALDIVFDGGTFSADFSECTHRTEAGYSSCVTRVPGAPLPPGAFVGIATPGTEPPLRTPRRGPRGTAAETPAAERAALVAFYNATDGPNWTHNTNWNTIEPVSTWSGVTTNEVGSVIHLYLHWNGLSGTIPEEIGVLISLRTLQLQGNDLSGSIPVELGGLTNLKTLDLLGNRLSGSIPAALGQLTNLERLSLHGNTDHSALPADAGGLSGSIPAALGDLTNLKSLSLSFNMLSGPIPAELGRLSNLEILDLGVNSVYSDGAYISGLSEEIPAALGNLTNLRLLDLSLNRLSGSIPPSLGRLTNLTHLYLYVNDLSGAIPTELGDLTNLERLWLFGNGFSGCVPAALAEIPDSLFDRELSYCRDLELVSAVLVGGAAVEITYDADLDESSVPSVGAFSVSVDGASRTISGVTVAGRVVTLTLASPITSAQRVTVSYTAPTAADAARIEATNGEAAASLSNRPATIESLARPLAAPGNLRVDSFSNALVGAGLHMLWEAPANHAGHPAISRYEVQYRRGRFGAWVDAPASEVAGASPSRSVWPLVAGADYRVRVRAVTSDGPGEWSAPVAGVAGDWGPQNVWVLPGDGALEVRWDSPFAANTYEVQWAIADTNAWTPVSIQGSGSPQRATIGRLANGTEFSVRLRALRRLSVGTDVSPTGQVTVASRWVRREATPGFVAAPTNLRVTGGDRSLEVSWNAVPGADGYDVEYRRARSLGGGAWIPYRQGRFSPEPMVNGSAVTLLGLESGGDYQVRVRAVDGLPSSTGVAGARSAWVPGSGSPGAGFAVSDVSSPRFVRGGGVVERQLLLVYDDGDDEGSGSAGSRDTRPFGSQRMGARIFSGPSAGHSVECRPAASPPPDVLRAHIAATGDALRGPCETDSEGRMTVVYTAEQISSNLVFDRDHVRVYVDANENDQRDSTEPYEDLDHAVRIVRPINYGALGDSYSAGENGEPNDQRPDPFEGSYLDADCRRWNMAYPWVIAGSPSYGSIGFYACSGAVTSDVYVPVGGGVFNGQSLSLNTLNTGLSSGSQQNVDMVTITIGGNDLGFADVINACFQLGGCGLGSLKTSIDQFKIELRKVLSGLKAAAPLATIFVLGYPQLVPLTPKVSCRRLHLDSVVAAIDDEYPHSAGFNFGNSIRRTLLNDYNLSAAVGISGDERQVLRGTAVDLNAAISDVAAEKGAHFVDVADEFAGHEPCGDEEKEAWLYGVVGERVDARVVDSPNAIPFSDRSFHPNAAGHREYARILRAYIEDALRGSDDVNRAGLPKNPPAVAGQRADVGSRRGAVTARATGESSGSVVSSDGTTPEASTGFLWARRVVAAASACAAPLAPGDQVELFAAGFAADSAVTFSVVGASVPAAGATSAVALSPSSTIPAATADAAGRLEVTWTIPDAPAATVDAAPRAYVVEASGTDGSDAAFAARSVLPLVVYPGVAPCAVDDTTSTSLGSPVRVAVLANDIDPAGGSLDAASVTVDAVAGGAFAVDTSDGSLTFTPHPGFSGTVTTRYSVYDGWDIGVSAAVTVTVDAGCTITGAVGVTVIEGTDGDDVICVGDPDDWDAFHVIDAKAGDDVVIGGDGVDWIYGGAGADVVYGRDGADRIDGGAGVDTIHGGDGFDTMHSGDLDDTIPDDAGGYELLLTAPSRPANAAPVVGADKAYVAQGETRDVAVLGNDHDPDENLVAASLLITTAPSLGEARVVVSADGEVVVRYVAGGTDGVDALVYRVCDTLDECSTAQVTVTVGTSHCTILGTEGADVLRGTAAPDVICGLGGDDTILGLGSGDVIIGGAGNDTLYGGDETLVGARDGDDALFGGPGDDTLYGGNGEDTLWGGPGDDTLEGNRRDDSLIGGPGDDSLNGGGENDTLWGGSGSDTLEGHAGADSLRGGPGDDTLNGGNGADTLHGGNGVDALTGGAGADTLWGGAGDDTLEGNTQNDTLWGGEGSDALHGGGHDDALLGGAGFDTLEGNAGDDRLWGNTGDDTLDGGNGTDYTDGGDGTDTCRRGETTARCET